MGSRGRSIRFRIYILVAIPLITMLGLFGYVAYTSVTNWLNLDRAPSLIKATSIPITNFVSFLQAERRAAIVYESQPTPANLAAYQATVTATKNGIAAFEQVINSPATTQNATVTQTAAMTKMVTDVNGMSGLRAEVTAKKLDPIDTLEAYSEIVADQDNVFQAQAASMTDTTASSQGLGLISAVNAREDLSEQDAVLAGALAANSLTGPDRAAFGQAAGRQFDDTQLYERLLTPSELTSFNATMNQMAPPATIQANLTKIQDAVEADIPLSAMQAQGLSPATWQLLTTTWSRANYDSATNAAATTLGTDEGLATSAKNRVWVTAGVGLAGLILTLIVSLLLSRSINRRLSTLRRSALTLAEEQLPSVVSRLRRGESVDVAAEAPPLSVGSDEIGQVGQAIDTVRQTAIRSAIDEARVRQGVNDMFRNLARRNQSLLQRQLSVLDDMERRATDPDVLDDLFKMDHLTTRMRRHAEGLIILSGAPPGRSWSAPVKLIDVMRGAVAEVEDYARVTVSTQARAALAGSAVTDVIHLLAELIENATTLSPPFTQVRVSGETVANGFAIEIEDRGLGMVPQRMQELNERLSVPPDINPANTEQLGLFVVGQLARRHGIRVVLRPSAYGGTTAIALVPSVLIVEDGPAAITSGSRIPAAAGAPGTGAPSNGAPSNGAPSSGAFSNGAFGSGIPASGAFSNGAFGHGASSNGAIRNGAPGSGAPGSESSYGDGYANGSRSDGLDPRPGGTRTGGSGLPSRTAARRGTTPGSGYPAPGGPDPRGVAASAGGYGPGNQDPNGSSIRIPDVPRPPEGTGGYGMTGGYGTVGGPGTAPGMPSGTAPSVPPGPAQPGARRGRHGTDDVPVVTGVPVGRPATPFDVFTPMRKPDQEGAPAADTAYQQPYSDLGGQQPGSATNPYADPDSSSYQGDGVAYGVTGNSPDLGNHNGDNGAGYEGTDSAGSGIGEPDNGLPRRVRQASLAPQLRGSAAATGSPGAAAVPPATAASLTVMRNTLSAMQRGWQQGRSQTQQDPEDSVDGN
jgi:signal transduction histidine kinase